MIFASVLKKAMIDMDINSVKELAYHTGVNYHVTLRLLRGDTTCRLVALIATANYLNVDLQVVNKSNFKRSSL